MLSVRCLSCPVRSVYDVSALWRTVGRIKMKLEMLVGLGPDLTVLDGDQAPLTKRGGAEPPPQF